MNPINHIMEDLLLRLDTWLKLNRPEFLALLRGGASEKDLSTFENGVGSALPFNLKELYGWHNGQMSKELFFQFAFELLGTNESLNTRTRLNEINEDILKDDPSSYWWSREWIPLLDNGSGDLVCVDLVGCFNGAPGQLVSFFHDDTARIIEYPSIEGWLATFVHSLELGMWKKNGGRLEPIDPSSFDEFQRKLQPGFPRIVNQ